MEDEEEQENEDDVNNMSQDLYEELEQEQESKHKTPVLKFGASKNRDVTPKSLSHSQSATKNPFKVCTKVWLSC